MATVTANDVINRAARRINVLAGEEVLSSAEANDALTLLNEMMGGWGPKGIHYVHKDLLATDTVNVPDEQVGNLVWAFAELLATEYDAVLNPTEMEMVRNAKLELQAAYPADLRAVVDKGIRRRLPGFYDFARDQ